MRYDIYIDLIWIINTIVNFCVLILLKTSGGYQVRLRRIFLSSILASFVFCILLCLSDIPFLFRSIAGVGISGAILVKTAFGNVGRKELLFIICSIPGYCFVLGGGIPVITGIIGRKGPIGIILTTCILTLFIWYYTGQNKKRKRRTQRLFGVKLGFFGKEIEVTGLYDTGNHLTEPYGKRPVCVIDAREIQSEYGRIPDDKKLLIPFCSIGKKEGLLQGVVIPSMEIYQKEKRQTYYKVVIALSDHPVSEKGEYQMILHPGFMSCWED